MKTLIKNGTLIDPANRVNAKLNLLLDGGKIAAVCENEPPADRVIDAAGKVVCPGFIDIHMHEDPVENGRLYDDLERSIFACMLRMGVTTAVGGNCGDSACHPAEYLELCRQKGSWTNVMMLAAHGWFREALTDADKYSPITPAQQKAIAAAMKDALAQGCAGISYGIRYIPGIDHDELYTTAACLQGTGKFLAAHMRDDADAVFVAQQELMDCGKALGIPVQISHIGSMAGFGQMQEFLRRADEARLNGLDISCDCYPYAAFSTSLGSTTYDPGWLERYHCDYSVLELSEGPYKGQRCTEAIFNDQRENFPSCKTVCYVMQPQEITLALQHPNVMLASDGTFSHGQGHPRASGAFPRLIREYALSGKLSLYDAIAKMTALPAARLGLPNKGRLNAGADADLVIFDPAVITDCATFAQPILPPTGLDLVLLGGEIAAENSVIRPEKLGTAVLTF